MRGTDDNLRQDLAQIVAKIVGGCNLSKELGGIVAKNVKIPGGSPGFILIDFNF